MQMFPVSPEILSLTDEVKHKPTRVLLNGKFRSWTLDMGEMSEKAKQILKISEESWSTIDDVIIEQIGNDFYAIVPWDQGHQGSGLAQIPLSLRQVYELFGIRTEDVVIAEYRIDRASMKDGKEVEEKVVLDGGKIVGDSTRLIDEIRKNVKEIGSLEQKVRFPLYDDERFLLKDDLTLVVEAILTDPHEEYQRSQDTCIRCRMKINHQNYICWTCHRQSVLTSKEKKEYYTELAKLGARLENKFTYTLPETLSLKFSEENLSLDVSFIQTKINEPIWRKSV